MKNKLLLVSFAMALPVYAGTPVKEVAPAPVSQPSLWTWFAGGSAGYTFDAAEAMYTGQVGVDTPWNIAGWKVALYAEVGYTEVDDHFMVDTSVFFKTASPPDGVKQDTEIIPITANIKFEHPLTDKLYVYVGGGLGMAYVGVESNSLFPPENYSGDDHVFTAQAFAGLGYNVCARFELFSGVRWIYVSDAKINGIKHTMGDDWMVELGGRVNF